MTVEKIWEYKYLHDPLDAEDEIEIEEKLNELGDEGWELVEVSGSELKLSCFIFKRPKDVRICSACGAENEPDVDFCDVCGASIGEKEVEAGSGVVEEALDDGSERGQEEELFDMGEELDREEEPPEEGSEEEVLEQVEEEEDAEAAFPFDDDGAEESGEEDFDVDGGSEGQESEEDGEWKIFEG